MCVNALPYDNKQSLVAVQVFDGEEQSDAELHYMNIEDSGDDKEESSGDSSREQTDASGIMEEGSGGTPGKGEEIDYSRDNQTNGVKAKEKAKGFQSKKDDKHMELKNKNNKSKANHEKINKEMDRNLKQKKNKKKREGKRKHYNAVGKKVRI